MIEIIKSGRKHACTCPECSCKFGYDDEDIMKDIIDYVNVFRVYVICPQCNKQVIIRQNIAADDLQRFRQST